MPSPWLGAVGGAAGGLQQELARRIAQENLDRRQSEIERSNKAEEDYRRQAVQGASADRKLALEQAAATGRLTEQNRIRDDTAARIKDLPMDTEFSPVAWKKYTDMGAVAPERGNSIVPYNQDFVGPIQPPDGGMDLRPQRGESIIKLRGTPTEIAADRTAKALEEQRAATAEENKHSAIYKEWRDYTASGGKLGFDEYATMDANRKKPTTPSGDENVDYSATALDMMAKNFARTNAMPPLGSGAKGVAARHAIVERASQYNPETDSFVAKGETNPNPPDLAVVGADYRANSDAIKKLVANQTAVGAFANTAKKNVELIKGTLSTLPDTGMQFLNRPYRAAAAQFGSTNVAKFNAIQNTLKNEYARLTSQPNLTGVLSDTARHETEAALGEGATVPQILAAFEALAQEGDNRHRAIDEELAKVRGQISPQRGATTTPSAEAETPEARAQRLRKAAGLP